MRNLGPLVTLAALAAAFYLLIIRPVQRRNREVAAVQADVVVGAEVMTTSGLIGTVRGLSDDEVELEVSPGIVLRFVRPAIGRVLSPDAEPSDDRDASD